MASIDQEVLSEVRRLIAAALDLGPLGDSPTLERLSGNHEVYRIHTRHDGVGSFVIKKHDSGNAHCNRLVADRWLPGIGLAAAAPKLIGTVATSRVQSVWHIYEDVGRSTLAERQGDPQRVNAAVRLIAKLHTLGERHPLLGECRRDGHDFGIHYFTTNVGDAADLLDALRPPAVRLTRQQADVRDWLRRRLDELLEDTSRRAQLIGEAGGAETMLHGDLWTTNVVLRDADDGSDVSLIDWDQVGAGPVSYDLSTFLYRFERSQRRWVFDAYGTAVADADWNLPSVPEFNILSDTAECARYANRIVWPAIALLHEGAQWGFGELSRIREWFDALEPVLDE